MAGLYTQVETVEKGNAILSQATRATSQFVNAANSILAEFTQYEAVDVPAAGFDAETLAEVETRKTATLTAIQEQLTTLSASLSQL